MTTTRPPVRRGTRADLPALLMLIQSAYRGESSRQGWTNEADLLDGTRTDAGLLSEALADPRTVLLVLDDENRDLIGCCVLTEQGGGVTEFGTFAVRPDTQGGGVGSALLAAAVDRARADGATCLEMTVIAQRTELIAWYRLAGVRADGGSPLVPVRRRAVRPAVARRSGVHRAGPAVAAVDRVSMPTIADDRCVAALWI